MSEERFICSICGVEHDIDHRHMMDEQALCADCLERETIVCSVCGTRIWNDDNMGNDNTPLCLVHFPQTGLYIYASTEEILGKAFKKLRLPLEKPVRVSTSCGDILRVDRQGAITTTKFSTEKLMRAWYYSIYCPSVSRCYSPARVGGISEDAEYADELKSVAGAFGYSPEDIDHLLDQGFTTDEIEEMLYCGEL